jgi:hypothetical protein
MNRFAAILLVIAAVAGVQAARLTQGPPEHTLTEQQRAHSRAYRTVLSLAANTHWPSLLAKPSDRTIGDESRMLIDFSGPRSMEEQLRNTTCASGLVVLGKAVGKSSYPTEDAQFVLTDYQFVVERAVRGTGVHEGDTVTYVRPGGSLAVKGTVIRARHDGFPELDLHDQYLLFADRIDTGALKVAEGGRDMLDLLRLSGTIASNAKRGRYELKDGVSLNEVIGIIATLGCSN